MTGTTTAPERIAAARARLSDLLIDLRPDLSDGGRAELDELHRRLTRGRLRLLLAGEFKRGKSSLVNALVGRAVLPTGVVPLTALPTVVRAAGPPGEDRVEVRYADGRVETCAPAALGELVTQTGNPDNRRGIARVEVVVGGAAVPAGVELVDRRAPVRSTCTTPRSPRRRCGPPTRRSSSPVSTRRCRRARRSCCGRRPGPRSTRWSW